MKVFSECNLSLSVQEQSLLNSNTYKCKHCQYICQNASDLISHQRQVHLSTCPASSGTSNTKRERKQRFCEISPEVLKCSQCAFQTYYYSGMKRHVTNHGKQKPYNCDGCGFVSKSKSYLHQHKLKYHPSQISKSNANLNVPLMPSNSSANLENEVAQGAPHYPNQQQYLPMPINEPSIVVNTNEPQLCSPFHQQLPIDKRNESGQVTFHYPQHQLTNQQAWSALTSQNGSHTSLPISEMNVPTNPQNTLHHSFPDDLHLMNIVNPRQFDLYQFDHVAPKNGRNNSISATEFDDNVVSNRLNELQDTSAMNELNQRSFFNELNAQNDIFHGTESTYNTLPQINHQFNSGHQVPIQSTSFNSGMPNLPRLELTNLNTVKEPFSSCLDIIEAGKGGDLNLMDAEFKFKYTPTEWKKEHWIDKFEQDYATCAESLGANTYTPTSWKCDAHSRLEQGQV